MKEGVWYFEHTDVITVNGRKKLMSWSGQSLNHFRLSVSLHMIFFSHHEYTGYLCFQVCVKNSFSLSYVITMIQKILDAMENGKKRLQFFNSVMDMFRELILDLHEFSDPGTYAIFFFKQVVIHYFKSQLCFNSFHSNDK